MLNNNYIVSFYTKFYQSIFVFRNKELKKIYLSNNAKNSPKIHDIYLALISEKNDSLGCFFLQLDDKTKAILKYHNNNKYLRVGQKVLVQVTKEATSPNKLANVTDNITLMGYLVSLLPLKKNIIFAKKLNEQDKIDIFNIVDESKGGVIVRSSYKSNLLEHFITEYNDLLKLYQQLKLIAKVGLVLSLPLLEKYLVFNSKSGFNEVITSSSEDLKIAKTIANKYKYLDFEITCNITKENLLNKYNLNIELETILDKEIKINDNLSLIFYQSNSFNYIDVDFKGMVGYTKEEGAFKANLEILPILRDQIVLRNLSGQILIDMLKLSNKQYKNNILNTFGNMLKSEKNTSVLGFSNLGLLEISKQKVQDSILYLAQNIYFKIFWIIINIKEKLRENIEAKIIVIGNKTDIELFKQISQEEFNGYTILTDINDEFKNLKILEN